MSKPCLMSDDALQQAEYLGLGEAEVREMVRRAAPYSNEVGVNRRFHGYAFLVEQDVVLSIREIASICTPTGVFTVVCPACEYEASGSSCMACGGTGTLHLYESEFNSYGVLDRHIVDPKTL